MYINTIWENHTICDCMYKFLCFLECIYFRCLKDDLFNGIDQKKKCYSIFKHSKAGCFPKFLYLLILIWLLLVLISFFYTTKYVANIVVSLDNTKESQKIKHWILFLRRIWVEMINAKKLFFYCNFYISLNPIRSWKDDISDVRLTIGICGNILCHESWKIQTLISLPINIGLQLLSKSNTNSTIM